MQSMSPVALSPERTSNRINLLEVRLPNSLNRDGVKFINDLILEDFRIDTLKVINGLLKAASIGIIPKDEKQMHGINDVLLRKFLSLPKEQRKGVYGVLKNILDELPRQGNLPPKIQNRGPIRHGILGFKDHIVHGDNWERLGKPFDFPRAIHQLSHQCPAPELGSVCKAYAEYLRSGGDISRFDLYLREKNVNFDDYFVNNVKRIAQNGSSWCQISPERPKGVLNISDTDIRRALEHRNWTGQNIDSLMSRNEPKTATFFDVYGDTIINTLKVQGIELSRGNITSIDLLKGKSRSDFIRLQELAKRIEDKSVDDTWKHEQAYLESLNLISSIRKGVLDEIFIENDMDRLGKLISIENDLYSMVDTSSINMLAKASKEENLMYNVEDKTKRLLLCLIENYKLLNEECREELELLKRDMEEIFFSKEKYEKKWPQNAMEPLNRMDRLVGKISKDISAVYRIIAKNLARGNKEALERAEQLADGMLRGDILFPISQICSGFKHDLRKKAGSSMWQILAPGKASGMVIYAENMEHLESLIKEKRAESGRFICFIDTLIGAEEPPKGVDAIITKKTIDTLSHIGVRSRQENVVFACLDDAVVFDEMKKELGVGKQFVSVDIEDENNIKIKSLSVEEYRELNVKKVLDQKPLKVVIPRADITTRENIIDVSKIEFSTSGPKATNIAKLGSIVPIPISLDIPFSVFDKVIDAPQNERIKRSYCETLDIINRKQESHDLSVDDDLQKMNRLINRLTIPEDIANEIMKNIREVMPTFTKYVMTRSSTNGEDLPNFSGAGLYSSQPNLLGNVLEGVKVVWGSKWNKRAFDARVKAEIPHEDLHVSVLIQPCIDTKYGFVTHTVNPLNKSRDEVFIELVQGQNEALVSGEIQGMGYGFIYNKKTKEAERVHLADKSYKLIPSESGGTKIILADYKEDVFSQEKEKWESVIKEIGEYSVRIEELYDGVPQDIEGCMENGSDKIYIVQTRDQLGLSF